MAQQLPDVRASSSGIDALLRNNHAYVARGTAHAGNGVPRTGVVIVTCMDARIDMFDALGLSPGDAHVIRNAGGVVTDDVIRSLLISRCLVGTREIMLIHHTGCAMTNAGEFEQHFHDTIGCELPFSLEAFSDVDSSVRESIRRVRSSPYLPPTEVVRGFVFEVGSGLLREIT